MYTWNPAAESYVSYLEKKSYLSELKGTKDRATSEIARGIPPEVAELLGSPATLEARIAGDLEAILGGMESGLQASAAAFNWGFSELLSTMGRMRTSIDELIRIARTPTQTAAYEQFEIARDFLRRELYQDALDALSLAIEGDDKMRGYSGEWRFHQLRGLIRLGSFRNHDPAVVNPEEAEKAFLLAAKYAKKDEPREAARAFLSAGFAAYVQAKERGELEKLEQAHAHTLSALALDPGLGEALFQAAKISAAMGQLDGAFPLLASAIEAAPGYAVRAAEDPDFLRHVEHLEVCLRRAKKESLARVAERIRDRVVEIEQLSTRTGELDASPELVRWRAIVHGRSELGLLDALNYVQTSLGRDEEVISNLLTRARQRRSTRVRAGRVEILHGTGEVAFGDAMVMVKVPPGRFVMGSPPSEDGRDSDEREHEVTITRPFELQTVPVTEALYAAVLKHTPPRAELADLPIVDVSWVDAARFCNALSLLSRLEEAYVIHGANATLRRATCAGYRLPTEAEWEYACRAGAPGPRYGALDAIAWHSGNATGRKDVGKKQPNALGLFDMLGNVWEWCEDFHAPYAATPAVDPRGPGTGSRRVHRGGAWSSDGRSARAARRGSVPPERRKGALGFRVARTTPG